MTGEEKLNSCKHRPDTQVEMYDGCPCRKIKKLVHKCDRRNILDIKSDICQDCPLYEQK